MVYTLYQLFMVIRGMVYYCFTHINPFSMFSHHDILAGWQRFFLGPTGYHKFNQPIHFLLGSLERLTIFSRKVDDCYGYLRISGETGFSTLHKINDESSVQHLPFHLA
jgi:hypothetical protein